MMSWYLCASMIEPVSIHNALEAFMISGATEVYILPFFEYIAAAPPHPFGYLFFISALASSNSFCSIFIFYPVYFCVFGSSVYDFLLILLLCRLPNDNGGYFLH